MVARIFIILIAVSTVHATPLWYPYAEWEFENPTYSGNPFDVEAEAEFTDGKKPNLFYDRGTTWKLRYMCTQVGEFSFSTTSSDPDLDGLTGSVDCSGNENGLGTLVPAGQNNKKWYINGWDKAISPAWAMYPGSSRDGWPTETEENTWIQNHLVDAGFMGVHHSGPANAWYDWGCNGKRSGCNTENPDPEAFAYFENLMDKLYNQGAFIHIWLFWDCQRDMCDANHDNIVRQERFRNYLADRWGAIPNWMIGEGFDNFEDDSTEFANKYFNDINSRLEWPHFIGMRSNKNSFHVICTDCNYYSWESQEEAGPMTFDRWKASYDNVPDRPAFEEDRYRYRTSSVKGPKNADDQRHYMWYQMMSGGVGAIYGYLEGADGHWSRIEGYPDDWESQIRIWHDFWYNDEHRYDANMERCDVDGYGLCGNSTIVYKEETGSIIIPTEGNAIAMDTKTGNYIDFGNVSENQEAVFLYNSDWVIQIRENVPNSNPCNPFTFNELVTAIEEWRSGTKNINEVMQNIKQWKKGC